LRRAPRPRAALDAHLRAARADDALLRVLAAGLCARELVALAACCRRFRVGVPSLAEAAAAAAARAAGWPARRVCHSWLTALRCTECVVALPCGLREGVRVTAYAANLVQAARRAEGEEEAAAEGEDEEEEGEGNTSQQAGAPALRRCGACGVAGNGWLNLSSGTLLCGRRQYDGSGGNSCALAHAAAQLTLRGTPSPLAAKLGTLSADLRAGELRCDVFSYGERDAVLDARLACHLAHWGVDPSAPATPVAEPSVAELRTRSDARFRQTVAAWFGKAEEEVSALLTQLGETQTRRLHALFAHGSRLQHAQRRAAAREAAARGDADAGADVDGDSAQAALPALPPIGALYAALAANPAALAEEAAALAMRDAAEEQAAQEEAEDFYDEADNNAWQPAGGQAAQPVAAPGPPAAQQAPQPAAAQPEGQE
jgi:hypothetical protein